MRRTAASNSSRVSARFSSRNQRAGRAWNPRQPTSTSLPADAIGIGEPTIWCGMITPRPGTSMISKVFVSPTPTGAPSSRTM